MSPIARARITYQYASGDAIQLTVEAETDYADVYDELAARVLHMYRETVTADASGEAES